MGASIWIFCLPLRNGLHGGCVEATACTVATAVGYRWDPRTSLTRCSWRRQGFVGETLWIGPRKKTWYLDWVQARNGDLLECRYWLFDLSKWPFWRGLPWDLRGDGALQNLCSWHPVAGIRSATFFQQQEFKLLIGRGRFLGAAVDWHRGSLWSSSTS